MVPLGRVGHRAPRQKGAAEKGRPAVVLFQHPEIDVVGHALPWVISEGLEQNSQLVPVLQLKDQLARLPFRRAAVESHLEGFLEEGGQTGGEGLRLGHDTHPGGGKRVAVEQRPVGLRLGAAPLGKSAAAQLLFGLGSKGQRVLSPFCQSKMRVLARSR